MIATKFESRERHRIKRSLLNLNPEKVNRIKRLLPNLNPDETK